MSRSALKLPPQRTHVFDATARQRLRSAQAALTEADRALRAAEAASQRARDLRRAAETAETHRETEERAAVAASERWAAAGAHGDLPEELQELLQKADAAASRARQAKLLAQGATRALSGKEWDEVRGAERAADVLPAEQHARDART